MEIDLTDQEFALFQKLIYEESGINLSPAKKELLKSRLIKRLRTLSLKSFREYHTYVTERDITGKEMIHMIDCISTNLTEFFREIAHFNFLSEKLLPALLEKKKKMKETNSNLALISVEERSILLSSDHCVFRARV